MDWWYKPFLPFFRDRFSINTSQKAVLCIPMLFPMSVVFFPLINWYELKMLFFLGLYIIYEFPGFITSSTTNVYSSFPYIFDSSFFFFFATIFLTLIYVFLSSLSLLLLHFRYASFFVLFHYQGFSSCTISFLLKFFSIPNASVADCFKQWWCVFSYYFTVNYWYNLCCYTFLTLSSSNPSMLYVCDSVFVI